MAAFWVAIYLTIFAIYLIKKSSTHISEAVLHKQFSPLWCNAKKKVFIYLQLLYDFKQTYLWIKIKVRLMTYF